MLRKFFVFSICVVCTISIVMAQQENNKPLVNSDVVNMIKAGLPESTIILSIQQSPANFDTSPQSLIDLKNQGASEKILEAILQSKKKKAEQDTKTTTLENPTSDISTSKNSVTKVNQYDFEFEFSGCKNAGGGDVICNFTINNKGTYDRQIVVLNESRLIDDLGNEYPTVVTRIGKASQNFGDFWRMYGTSGVLIPQTVTMSSIQFKQINPNAKLAKVLRLVCKWERPNNDDYNFTVDFRDVSLTAFTSSQLQADIEKQYEAQLASILKGEQVTFLVKHRHPGLAFGMDVDICDGQLILSKDSLEFQGSVTSHLARRVGFHDFKISYTKIYEITVSPEKFGKLFMKVGIEKKDGKEDKKEFNFYPNEAALKDTGIKSPYYEVDCDRKCTEKSNLIKRLIDQLILNSKQSD